MQSDYETARDVLRAFDAESRQRRAKELGLALRAPDDGARAAAVAEARTIETNDAKFMCCHIPEAADGESCSIVPLPWNMTSGGASGSPFIVKCNRTPLMSRNSPIGGLRQRAMNSSATFGWQRAAEAPCSSDAVLHCRACMLREPRGIRVQKRKVSTTVAEIVRLTRYRYGVVRTPRTCARSAQE